MDIITKIKKNFQNINIKKIIRRLLILLLIGAIILVTSSIINDNKNDKDTLTNNNSSDVDLDYTIEDYATILEEKLACILSEINGVGKVNVMITLGDTTEKIPATNITRNQETSNEEDGEGGVREVKREDYTSQIMTKGSEGSLIVLKEIKPEVNGVIIVAEGAENLETREKLYQAVKTVLGISGNKVEVYSSN